MSEPHVIRLRGPWVRADGSRVKLPAVWTDVAGEAREATLRRVFHRPTILDDYERVLLRVNSPHDLLSVTLNDESVADRQDITSWLKETNQLVVTVGCLNAGVEIGILQAELEIWQK